MYLDDRRADRLARLAQQEGRSQAEVIREAIDAYEPKPLRDRDFALAAGFARVDADSRPISQISKGGAARGLRRLTLLIGAAPVHDFASGRVSRQ